MADEVKKPYQTALTIREKAALYVLIIMYKLLKATDYYGEEEVKKIRELIELV